MFMVYCHLEDGKISFMEAGCEEVRLTELGLLLVVLNLPVLLPECR